MVKSKPEAQEDAITNAKVIANSIVIAIDSDVNEDSEEEDVRYSEDDVKKRGIYLIGCRFDIILRVAMECNFKIVGESDSWVMCWSDLPLLPDKIYDMKMKQYLGGPKSPRIQKFNHFPSMYEICRKDRLGRNLNRMKRIFPRDYDFYPLTWDLPSDLGELIEYGKKHRNTIYIVKPDAGCQGKGIFLINTLKNVCPYVKCVCQLYIGQPLLVDGFKFDQRIYVLVTCTDPLRIYVYRDGIARFATVKYQMPSDSNLEVTYMHLTNYSLNKFSDNFDDHDTGGTKRPLTEVYSYLCDLGYDVKKLQEEVDDIVIKAIVCVAPSLRHSYRATFSKREKGCYCYELLGFDILVDRDLKPLLIEINASPSFNLDTPADAVVKYDLVRDLFAMLYLNGEDPPGKLWKECLNDIQFNIQRKPGTSFASTIPDTLKDQFVHEEKNHNNFRLLFSEDVPGKYAKYMDQEYFLLDEEDEDDRLYFRKIVPQRQRTESGSESRRKVTRLFVPTPIRQDGQDAEAPNGIRTMSRSRNSEEEGPVEESPVKRPPTVAEMFATKIFMPSFDNSTTIKPTPSERVQKALEQLRKKNLDKFKSIAKENQAMLAHYSGMTLNLEELSSGLKYEPNAASTSNKLPNVTNDNVRPDKKCTPVQAEVQVTVTDGKSVRFSEKLSQESKSGKNKSVTFTTSPTFKPLPMDMFEERRRIRSLASRKRAIGILGIAETARQVIEAVAASQSQSSQYDEL